MRKLPVNNLKAKRWMIVDNFAGGGGVSTGIEMAVGRSPDVAINHDPVRTADSQNRYGLVQSFLAQHNTGVIGHPATVPLSTITGRGTQQQIVEASFVSYAHQSGSRKALESPIHTITASRKDQQHHVKAFLMKYYGEGGQHQDCRDPLHTIPTCDRLGIVTVEGVDFEIVDIGMRMLTARELFRAQGFPDSYKIDVPAPNKQGKVRSLPKDAQVRMCGNSVCPDVAAALVAANCQFIKAECSQPIKRQLELAGI